MKLAMDALSSSSAPSSSGQNLSALSPTQASTNNQQMLNTSQATGEPKPGANSPATTESCSASSNDFDGLLRVTSPSDSHTENYIGELEKRPSSRRSSIGKPDHESRSKSPRKGEEGPLQTSRSPQAEPSSPLTGSRPNAKFQNRPITTFEFSIEKTQKKLTEEKQQKNVENNNTQKNSRIPQSHRRPQVTVAITSTSQVSSILGLCPKKPSDWRMLNDQTQLQLTFKCVEDAILGMDTLADYQPVASFSALPAHRDPERGVLLSGKAPLKAIKTYCLAFGACFEPTLVRRGLIAVGFKEPSSARNLLQEQAHFIKGHRMMVYPRDPNPEVLIPPQEGETMHTAWLYFLHRSTRDYDLYDIAQSIGATHFGISRVGKSCPYTAAFFQFRNKEQAYEQTMQGYSVVGFNKCTWSLSLLCMACGSAQHLWSGCDLNPRNKQHSAVLAEHKVNPLRQDENPISTDKSRIESQLAALVEAIDGLRRELRG